MPLRSQVVTKIDHLFHTHTCALWPACCNASSASECTAAVTAVRMTITVQQDKGRAADHVPQKLCCITPNYTASCPSTWVYFVRKVSNSNYQFPRMPCNTKFHNGQHPG